MKKDGGYYFYITINLKLGNLIRRSLVLSAVESATHAVHESMRHTAYYTKTRFRSKSEMDMKTGFTLSL